MNHLWYGLTQNRMNNQITNPMLGSFRTEMNIFKNKHPACTRTYQTSARQGAFFHITYPKTSKCQIFLTVPYY